MEKIIITIGREFGSGGHEIGKKLAKELGIAFYDGALIEKAAENMGVHKEYIRFNEEKAPELSMSSFFSGFDSFHTSPFEKIQNEEFNIIREIAEKESCVIVGRAADYILRDETHVSIFTFAPIEARMERIRTRTDKYEKFVEDDLSEVDLLKLIKAKDKQRRKFYEFYTENKWGDRDNYDLLINTDRTGIEGAIEIIKTYINESRGKNLVND